RVPRQERTEGRLEAMARELRGLQAISCRVNRAGCLEVLLESVLQALEEELGFRHAMVLLPDERGRLVTTASHGYGSGGVGASRCCSNRCFRRWRRSWGSGTRWCCSPTSGGDW